MRKLKLDFVRDGNRFSLLSKSNPQRIVFGVMAISEIEDRPTLETIMMIEKKDEEQIIGKMRGEVVQSWIYSFTQNGKQITSLSYNGVKEAIRRRGNLSWYPCDHCHKPVHIEETETEIIATVTAWDLNNNVRFIGTASANKKQPFSWVLATNKAERNALRKMLPEKAIALLIEEYLKKPQANAKLL